MLYKSFFLFLTFTFRYILQCKNHFLMSFHRGRIQAACYPCRRIWSRLEFWMKKVLGVSGPTCPGSCCTPQMTTRSDTVFRPIQWCWGTWPFRQLIHRWDIPSTHPRPSTCAVYDSHFVLHPINFFLCAHPLISDQHANRCYPVLQFHSKFFGWSQSNAFNIFLRRVQWIKLF